MRLNERLERAWEALTEASEGYRTLGRAEVAYGPLCASCALLWVARRMT